MRPPGSVSRRLVLTAVAALGLHSLRASAGWGGHAHHELDAAHAYVPSVTSAVLLAAALLTGHFLFRLVVAPAPAPSSPDRPRAILRGWCWTSLILTSICIGQEILEHLWLTGALPAPQEALSAGGWTLIPLTALLGGVVIGAAWGCDVALTVASCSAQTAIQRVPSRSRGRRLESAHRHGREPLAGLPAGRAPPVAVFFL
jgi:hypothetical protein